MTVNALIFLLNLVHVSGTLYGPKLLLTRPGGSLKIKCYYLTTIANKHDRKFWCKESYARGPCQTITSTNDFTMKGYEGRVSIHDSPQNGFFQVTMTQLRKTDSGYYKCGIGKIDNGLYARMKVTVWEGPNLPLSPQLIWGKLRGLVIIHCPSGDDSVEMKRYFCKMSSGCNSTVGRGMNNIKQKEGRIVFNDSGIPGTFNVFIKELRKQDSGMYKCGILDDTERTRIIQLEVTEESVFFNIRNDTQVIYESQTIGTSSYNYMTSSDENYQERFSKNKLNPFPIVIPIIVLLIIAAAIIIVLLKRRQQKKRASSNNPERNPEAGIPLGSPKCSEEHSSRNEGSAGIQECAASPSKEISSVYCLLGEETNPTNSGDNE